MTTFAPKDAPPANNNYDCARLSDGRGEESTRSNTGNGSKLMLTARRSDLNKWCMCNNAR